MKKRICPYCQRKFDPSPYHHDQVVCSAAKCQQQRKSEYHRKKLRNDLAYREQCRDSQKKWLAKNPKYMKKYVAKRPKKLSDARIIHLLSELQRLLYSEKNNVAFSLQAVSSRLWLVSESNTKGGKNILAHAKVLAIRGTVYLATLPK